MTKVMGILNATPDSFSDGGDLSNLDKQRDAIAKMIEAGADILDVGGESTRPGHEPVAASTEISRVAPVIEVIREHSSSIPISIDTSKAEVASKALELGATIVNDVSGLADENMANVVLTNRAQIILMRSRDLNESDIVDQCRKELDAIVQRARLAGIPDGWTTLDPGLGFGNPPGPDVDANLKLVDSISHYSQGFNVLIGASRKRFIGAMMEEPDPKKRTRGSVEVAVRAARAGAAIVRVHDVPETVDALSNLSD